MFFGEEVTPLTISSYIMQHDTINVIFRGVNCRISLDGAELIIWNISTDNVIEAIRISDIIGCKLYSRGSARVLSYLDVYSLGLEEDSFITRCTNRRGKRKLRTATFEFPEESSCEEWSNRINGKVSPVDASRTSRKFVVFVNPASGQGQAVSVWDNEVKPMLAKAGVEARVVITQYANHARHCMKTGEGLDPLLEYEAILAVGGDGLIFEVINGIAERSDGRHILESVAIAPIPGGTGNGLVKSLLFESGEEYSVANAVFLALKGNSTPIDLSVVQTTRGAVYHSFLLLGWGLISDIDLQSEGLRWMGEARLYAAAVYYAMRNRRYPGTIYMFTGNGIGSGSGSQTVQKSSSLPLTFSSSSSLSSRTLYPAIENSPKSLPALEQSMEEMAVAGSGWEVLRGSFLLVWVVQTSHATATMYSGPGVTTDDGLFTVFVVEELSAFEALQLLIAMDTGGHASHPKVKTYRCSAYRIVPASSSNGAASDSSDSDSDGLYTLDGERVDYGPIQGLMQPRTARVKKLRPSTSPSPR
jgi:sphingosine kinase